MIYDSNLPPFSFFFTAELPFHPVTLVFFSSGRPSQSTGAGLLHLQMMRSRFPFDPATNRISNSFPAAAAYFQNEKKKIQRRADVYRATGFDLSSPSSKKWNRLYKMMEDLDKETDDELLMVTYREQPSGSYVLDHRRRRPC